MALRASQRYRVLHPLEPGPGVRVFLVEDLWQEAARKVLTLIPGPFRVGDPDTEAVEELYNRRRSVRHPLLVEVLDLEFRGRQVGFITGFNSQPNLALPIRCPLHRRVELALELCMLLRFLHHRGILVGWLSPRKIFFDPRGNLLLNSVVPASADSQPTPYSLRYCAPEILEGSPPTPESDRYSLGMLLYLLLTGLEPFGEADAATIRAKQLAAEPTQPSKLIDDFPALVERAILSLIAKNPTNRCTLDRTLDALANCAGPVSYCQPTPKASLVGRVRELQFLKDAILDFAAKPRSLLVLLHGPSGIGKSYLSEHSEVTARLLGIPTILVNHNPEDTAFEPFRTILGQLHALAVHSFDSPESPEHERPTTNRSRSLSLTELTGSFLNASRERPLLVRASDIHYVDEGSAKLYLELLSHPAARILVIADCRSEDATPNWQALRQFLSGQQQMRDLPIGPLSDKSAMSLIAQLMPNELPKSVRVKILSAAAGNPFYVETLIQYLIEERVLIYGSQGWSLTSCDLPYDTIPTSILQSIQLRLDRLSAFQLKVVRALAVMSRSVTIDVLAGILEEPIGGISEAVSALEQSLILRVHGRLAHSTVSFAHHWIMIAVKKQLDRELESALHRRIYAFFTSSLTSWPESLEEIARHAIEGELRDDSCSYIEEAILSLRERHLYQKAATLMERAIHAGSFSLKDSRVLISRIELLYLAGRTSECESLILESIESVEDDSIKGILIGILGRIQVLRGEVSKANTSLERALSLTTGNYRIEFVADLLSCLSRSSSYSLAQKYAADILLTLKRYRRNIQVEVRDKLFHSIYFFFIERGLYLEAINSENRALRCASRCEHPVRVAGRLFNLSASYLSLGLISYSFRLNSCAEQIAFATGNSQLQSYCSVNALIASRKGGGHSKALKGSHDLLLLNERVNRNPHLEVELHIEIAKNACYQLVLPLALEHLNAIKELPACGQVSSSNADALLLEGWTRILMGRPEEAIELAEKVRRQEIPREAGRSYLLSGQAFMALGNLESAAVHAQSALDRFPVSVPYYRTRARILQAEVALRTPTSKRAGAYVEGALRLARDHFYQPLLAKAFCLKAECLRRRGELTRARAHALRAQQVASRVERPALLAEILLQLSRVEEEQGARLQAEERRAEARELIASRRDLLPETQREGFARAFAEFLREPEAAGPPQLPRTLVGICELATRFREGRRVEDLATSLLDCLQRQLKVTGVQLYTPGRDGTPRVVASARKCHLDGRELIQSDGPPGARVRVLGRTTTLVVPLEGRNRVEGWIYLERVGGTLPEVDYDFLACVKAIAEIPLFSRDEAGGVPPRKAPAGSSHGMVGEHPSMIGLRAEIARFAQSDSTVLISGESGTGKELVAREIHGLSKRSEGPFLAVNCAGFAADLIESQLFGHARGSFTGAVENRVGFFEAAAGGTLFLDEISSMPLSLQPKLLRVLQEKKVIRLGETAERSVDTRIVAATNQDLKQLAARGEFRPDLYHRLNVLQIHVPPLRLRASDIPALCRHFLAQIRQESGVDAVLSNSALEALRRCDFPGNIRELRNLLENLAHTAAHGIITLPDVERRLQGDGRADDRESDRQILGILDEIVSGRADFWGKVRDPFMKRELSRRDVMRIVAKGLEACGGSYRQLTEYLGMKPKDYKRLLNFLANHQCKVDFRTYRTGGAEE
jgi:DNA-binding NtrC family response regulator/tetratricopeptide (TPR) repeat protein